MKNKILKQKAIFISFLALLVNPLFGYGQNDYHLIGKLVGLPVGIDVYLVKNKNGGGNDTIAVSKSQSGGIFHLQGLLKEDGEICFIKFQNLSSFRTTPKTSAKYINVAVENGSVINIVGHINDLSENGVKITGSKAHLDYLDITGKYNDIIDQMNKYRKDALERFQAKKIDEATFKKEMMDDAQKRDIPLRQKLGVIVNKWIQTHPSSLFAPWVIMRMGGDGQLAWMEMSKQSLSDKSKQSHYGIELQRLLEKMKATSNGSIAPDFSFIDNKGFKTSLHSIASKSKYTIVDFWASWCTPCRAGFSSMRVLYDKYKNKGLEIVGYSTDKKEEDWKEALKQEQLPWYNTRAEDPLFAKEVYGVNKLPTCYIIDNAGKIVANGLHSDSLISKIKELLGE